MSGFWSLKIGKGTQDSKEPAKKNGNKNKSNNKVPSDIVQALMERALTDAEQLVESVKARARKEAEIEVARIVEEAKNILAEKDISDIAATVSQDDREPEYNVAESQETVIVEPPVNEVKEPTIIAGLEPAETDYKAEVIEDESPAIETDETLEPQPAAEPVAIEESVEIITEPLTTEAEKPQAVIPEVPVNEEVAAVIDRPNTGVITEADGPDEVEIDKAALYSEDVEIAIGVPVDPVAVSKLYNNLQMTPEIKILYTRGSWDKGTIITVNLEKPLPLMDIISSIPGIDVKVIKPQKKDSVKGTPSALLGNNKEELIRIDLQMKAK